MSCCRVWQLVRLLIHWSQVRILHPEFSSIEQTNQSQILLYQTEDGRGRIEVRLQDETVWLTQKLMAELFQTTPQDINIHIKNIFSEGEVSSESVIKESLITASDGKKYQIVRSGFYGTGLE
jgi:hypothetical protein